MKCRGFTLIELMLVISIIMMIMALLMPALLTVRARALVAQCQSNLHHIYLAFWTYAHENEGLIPCVAAAPMAADDPEHLIDPRTGAPTLRYSLRAYLGSERITKCPADTGVNEPGFSTGGRSCFDAWGQSYSYNTSIFDEPGAPGFNARRSHGTNAYNPVNIDSVPNPDKYMLMSDFSPRWHGKASGNRGGFYLNILFFDGHVIGMSFDSARDAQHYINSNEVSRWWVKK